MAPLLITCTGESTIYHPAERAVVFLTISSDGISQPEVSQAVTKTANAVQSHLKTIAPKDSAGQAHETAPVTHWSMSTLYTGSWQPDDADGTKVPRRFSASTRLEVTFRDFQELGGFTSNLASTEFVGVDRIEWRLTEATKMELGRRCRRDAVKDAMLKAKDYADAAGKADFEILEITDGRAAAGYSDGPLLYGGARHGGGAGGEELSYEPEDVSISCSVTAKFDAA